MFVLSDNRLAPGESLQLQARIPDEEGSLVVDGIYHVMTTRQLKRLQDNYGLQDPWPIERPFIERQPLAIAGH